MVVVFRFGMVVVMLLLFRFGGGRIVAVAGCIGHGRPSSSSKGIIEIFLFFAQHQWQKGFGNVAPGQFVEWLGGRRRRRRRLFVLGELGDLEPFEQGGLAHTVGSDDQQIQFRGRKVGVVDTRYQTEHDDSIYESKHVPSVQDRIQFFRGWWIRFSAFSFARLDRNSSYS